MPSFKPEDHMTKAYIPIDTDVVDNIEHYAVDKIHVQIEYRDREGSSKALRGFIGEVYTTESHEEYLKMVDGRILRLDQLLKVEPTGDEQPKYPDLDIDLGEKLDIKGTQFFPNGMS